MSPTTGIIRQTEEFVTELFRDKLPSWAVYHNLEHTTHTVSASRQIARGLKVGKRDLEVVTLASWLHDTGYLFTANGHEERSVRIAMEFLTERDYPPERIEKISGCIMATKMPQRPRNLLERIVCDADLASLGKHSFFRQNELLRNEIERRDRIRLNDMAWLRRSYRFLLTHRYHTRYARSLLTKGRLSNLTILRSRLRKAHAKRLTSR